MSNFKATGLMLLLVTALISSVYLVSNNLTVAAQSSTATGPSITWETVNAPEYLDPGVAYYTYDYAVLANTYESLLWYNGTCAAMECVIPWLAQSYTTSSDLKTYQFTLRPGIKFADGEALDSTAVYFSFNRLLIEDGSTPVGHGTEASWILQQLLNKSLSTWFGGQVTYNSAYVDSVLAENFVSITGPTTFTINVMNSNAAFPYLLTVPGADPVAPNYVMQHDLALWNQTSTGYKLPYPSLSSAPDEMTRIKDYFYDEVATCNAGTTPSGCGTTYLDHSYGGSLAGTGPYTIQSVSQTNTIVYQANPNYWGGPLTTKISPTYQIATINYIPDVATREIDLRSAAAAGRAFLLGPGDLPNDHLYDVADRNLWLNNNTLQSAIPGVSLYGPYIGFATLFINIATNVTNTFTGKYYSFQPFADRRFRLAFADAVNLTEIMRDINNNLGQVATSVIPPDMPPAGSYNPTLKPAYSYNLDAVQNLLLDAMMHPLTSFNFENGTAAPPGTFNNAFGCATLSSSGTCTNPIPQTITLNVPTGDTVNTDIMNTIASNINNVSSTYNMGLTVNVSPIPSGTLVSEVLASHTFMVGGFGWFDDYPWVTDFLGGIYAPGQFITGPGGWNFLAMGTLFNDAVNASASGDLPRLVQDTNAMVALGNQAVMYLWTDYPEYFYTFTSGVTGFFWNPQWGVNGPYFASLSPSTMTPTSTPTTSAAATPSANLTVAAVVVAVIIIVAISALVARGRKKTKT